MKHLFRVLIQAYWILIPEKHRKTCLFRESCSRYVYRETTKNGFLAGIGAIRQRFLVCRTEYELTSKNGTIILHLCDGTQIFEDGIAFNLINSMKPMDVVNIL